MHVSRISLSNQRAWMRPREKHSKSWDEFADPNWNASQHATKQKKKLKTQLRKRLWKQCRWCLTCYCETKMVIYYVSAIFESNAQHVIDESDLDHLMAMAVNLFQNKLLLVLVKRRPTGFWGINLIEKSRRRTAFYTDLIEKSRRRAFCRRPLDQY